MFAVALSNAVGAAPAVAQSVKERSVPAGAAVQIDAFGSLKPDCSPRGIASLKVTRQPRMGRLITKVGETTATFPAGHPLERCNGRTVPARLLAYQALPARTGQDRFGLRVRYPSGHSEPVSYVITVR